MPNELPPVERLAAKLAASDGLDWNEVCAYEGDDVPDNAECNSGTCVAAHYEDHDPEVARGNYLKWAQIALEEADHMRPTPASAGDAGEVERVARAICLARHEDPDRLVSWRGMERIPLWQTDEAFAMADAAIAALNPAAQVVAWPSETEWNSQTEEERATFLRKLYSLYAHLPATPEQTNSTATHGGEPGEAQDVSPAHGATPEPDWRDAEIERQEGLVAIYRQAQLTAEEKLCRAEASEKGWKSRCQYLEGQLKAVREGRGTTTLQSPSEAHLVISTSTDAKPADTKAGPEATPQPGQVDKLREAIERFLADYDDSDRADAGCSALMEAHVADFRSVLSTPAEHPSERGRDWKRIAKLAGEHGVRYRTNAAMDGFLNAIERGDHLPSGEAAGGEGRS